MARKETEINEVDEAAATEMETGENDGAFLPQRSEPMALGQVQGEVSNGDIPLPRLKMAYGVGSLAENFTPGDLVLADDYKLASKNEPISIIILNATRYWKEYLSNQQFQDGVRPRVFMTENEVLSAGGTVRWVNGVGPTFSPAMNLKLLIKKPEDLVCGLFGIAVGDDEYAAAEWDVDKTAYKRVGPNVLSAAQFSLRERGLFSGTFSLETKMEKSRNGNIIPSPLLKLESHNSDEVIEQIKSYFENPVTANA